ncbi:hypothetical protein DL770_006027 [Monosporascus sp. CRB-9-2]|nr:hypothetical protein DL770_006027 [Monosporascus sp. CRB-9-2]
MESSEECRYTLAPGNSGVSTRLHQKCQVLDYRRRKLTWLLRHYGPALGLRNPTEVPPRADGTPDDPRFRTYDGYACRLCSVRVIHHPTIERHVTAEHPNSCFTGWKRVVTGEYDDAYLQAWTKNQASWRYWIVERNGTTDRPPLQPEDPERLGTAPASTLAELRTWLQRTRWEEAYQHMNREVLSAMAAMPHPAPLPRRVALDRCGSGSGACRLEADLASAAEDEWKIAALPRLSAVKYYALLRRLVAMVFRAYRMPRDVRWLVTGTRLTRSQLGYLDVIWDYPGFDDASSIDGDDDGYVSGHDASDYAPEEQVHSGLSVLREKHAFTGTSPLSRCLATPSYTSHLSGIIYVQRLLFLEYAALGLPRRRRRDPVGRLASVRVRYMMQGSQSWSEEFESLRSFGRAMTGSDRPPFLLRWSEDGRSVSHGDTPALRRALVRWEPHSPFAGISVIFFGDFLQFDPVRQTRLLLPEPKDCRKQRPQNLAKHVAAHMLFLQFLKLSSFTNRLHGLLCEVARPSPTAAERRVDRTGLPAPMAPPVRQCIPALRKRPTNSHAT